MSKGELPADLTADELNKMIAALAREHDIPDGVYPDLVELYHIPQYVYGYNTGCKRTGLDEYKEGQKWRRRLITELKRSPTWIAEWRAARDLDRRIEALCEAKGLHFAPWELPPWRAPDELPERDNPDFTHLWRRSLPHAVRLRWQLLAELAAADG
jgi:hypothetical protein